MLTLRSASPGHNALKKKVEIEAGVATGHPISKTIKIVTIGNHGNL